MLALLCMGSCLTELLVLEAEELVVDTKFVHRAQRSLSVLLITIVNCRLYNLVSFAPVLAFKLRK